MRLSTTRAIAMAFTLALVGCGLVGGQMGGISEDEEEMLQEMGITGQPMGRKNQQPKFPPVKSDLKYIRCSVCRKQVELAYTHAQQVLAKRFKHQSKRKNEVTEFDGEAAVQDYIEKFCNADKPDSPGAWIKKQDLVNDGDKLVLFEHPNEGHCEYECRTVERACEEVVDAADIEFSEILYQAVRDDLPLEKVQRQVCNRVAKVCKKAPPKLDPKRVDYDFREMTAEEKQMADMMANLKDSGMGGTMYRREDLMDGMAKMEEKFGSFMGTGEGNSEEAEEAEAGEDEGTEADEVEAPARDEL